MDWSRSCDADGGGTAAAVPLDEAQQQCVNRLNYDAAQLAKEQGNENLRCLQRATRNKLSPGQTADDCLVADAKGRIAYHQDRIERDVDYFCSGPPPPFGLPSGTVAATYSTVPREQSVALVGDIFVRRLTRPSSTAPPTRPGARARPRCPKAYEKIFVSTYKIFLHCKKVFLRNPCSADPRRSSRSASTPSPLRSRSRAPKMPSCAFVSRS
jgi:hypothetical protein